MIESTVKGEKKTPVIAAASVLIVIVFILSLAVGRFPVPPADVLKILLSPFIDISSDWNGIAESVILRIRLPRVIMALAGGAGLGICGAVFSGNIQKSACKPGSRRGNKRSRLRGSTGYPAFRLGLFPPAFFIRIRGGRPAFYLDHCKENQGRLDAGFSSWLASS